MRRSCECCADYYPLNGQRGLCARKATLISVDGERVTFDQLRRAFRASDWDLLNALAGGTYNGDYSPIVFADDACSSSHFTLLREPTRQPPRKSIGRRITDAIRRK